MRLIDADALNLDYEVKMADDWKTAHEIANIVKYAPTIDAVSVEWIPCEERLPNSDDYTCLVNVIADGVTYPIILAPYYEVEEMYKRGCVNAWMPLPKPYERSDT